MQWDGYDWPDVTYFLTGLAMGLAIWVVLRIAKVLTGISEIEESYHSSPLDPNTSDFFNFDASNDNFLCSTPNAKKARDPDNILAIEGNDDEDNCSQRVRASRSPVRHPSKPPACATRRSLSLPNGGLSYNDAKIQYRDGHFVAVDSKLPQENGDGSVVEVSGFDLSATSLNDVSQISNGQLANDEHRLTEAEQLKSKCFSEQNVNGEAGPNVIDVPKPTRVKTRRPLGRSYSAAKELRTRGGGDADASASLRAEILSLLERGITDPQRLFREAALLLESKEASRMGSSSSASLNYRSLPRRRHRNQRPISMDEAQLGKGWSQSQQSLIRHYEEDDENSVEESSLDNSVVINVPGIDEEENITSTVSGCLRRNDSFSKAVVDDEDTSLAKDSAPETETSVDGDLPSHCVQEGYKSDRSRSKGPGFIQRMLQKRKGTSVSSASSEKPLSISISKPFASREEALLTSPLSTSPSSSADTATPSPATAASTTAASSSSTSHRSKGERGSRDSSISRRMSLKNIFKRKNSMSSADSSSANRHHSSETNISSDNHRLSSSDGLSPTASISSGRVRQNSESLSYLGDETSYDYSDRSRSTLSLISTASTCSEASLNITDLLSPEYEKDVFDTGSSMTLPSKGRRSRSLHSSHRQPILRSSSMSYGSKPASISSNVSASSHVSLSLESHRRLDYSSSDLRSSEDTLTPKSTSPAPEMSFVDCDRTLVATPTPKSTSASPDVTLTDGDKTLVASPSFSQQQQDSLEAHRGRSSTSRALSNFVDGVTLLTSELLGDPLVLGGRGEITSSNSNDSGIQRDVCIDSSVESVQSGVILRDSALGLGTLSERPKSDVSVRWADILPGMVGGGHSSGVGLARRRDPARLTKAPRPKSDIGGWRGISKSTAGQFSAPGASSSYDAYGSLQNSVSTPHVPDEVDRALQDPSLRRLRNSGSSTSGRDWGSRHASENNLIKSGDSLLSLSESRRGVGGALSVSAALAKLRRMSTPQPITNRKEKPTATPIGNNTPGSSSSTLTATPSRTVCVSNLIRSRSMPENLDRLRRKKKNYLSLMAPDAQSLLLSQNSLCDEDSSDESEYSVDLHHPGKYLSTRNSHLMLAALDQMLEEENLTYAEALWDHVTLDPDELGFRAGDLIRVLDMSDKHWWYGLIDGMEGWFPASFVRLRINQDCLEDEISFLLKEGEDFDQVDSYDMVDGHRRRDDSVVDVMTRSVTHSMNHAAPHTVVDKQQARANVVREIIHAEREYVKHLKNVVEGYVKNARKRPEMFPAEKVTTIFANIEDIYDFALDLLNQLEGCIDHEQPYLSELGQCFLDHSKGFEMYSDYCNNHPAACDELRELYRNKRYRHFFEACRLLQDMIEIPLEGFLLTPVQKICKYHLQLAELLKFTPATHGDHDIVKGALDAMKRIATLINERKRKMESIEKLAAWQLMVDDWEGPDILDRSSESIYSGELIKVNPAGWSQERSFFLFDHQLVYTKKDRLKRGSYGFKGRIDMDHCEVISVADGRDSQYGVSVRNAWKLHETKRDKCYLLVAKTPQLKQRWLKAFQDERRRVKEDVENDFNIPDHVKQSAIASIKQRSSLHKPKSRGRRFTRANSSSALESESYLDIGTFATLPRNRNKDRLQKSKSAGLSSSKSRLTSWLSHSKDKFWK